MKSSPTQVDSQNRFWVSQRETQEELEIKHWTTFAADSGIGLPLVRRRVKELSKIVAAKSREVAATIAHPGFDQIAINKFAESVVERAGRCALTVLP